MKRKEYLTYNHKQLLKDEFFINSNLEPTVVSEEFWNNLEKENDIFSKEFQKARSTLLAIPYRTTQLSRGEEDILFNRIQKSILEQRRKRNLTHLFSISSVAAGLVLLCLFSWYYINDDVEVNNIYQIAQQLKPDVPITDIQLIQSGQSELIIYGNESDIEYDNEGNLYVRSQHQIKETSNVNKEESPSQLAVPPGKRSLLTLSDGTRVWVNANSRVIYPDVFDSKERFIYVDGEVFLDVKHDPNRPFLVHTDKMIITVKGTSFNVSAYQNDPEVSVVLVTGSVKVNTSGEEHLLSPSEMLHITDNQIYKEEVNVYNHISWKYGSYSFDNEKFSVILQKLSRYYNTTIKWDKSVEDLYCSGSLNLSDDIDKLLSGLKTAVPVKYTKTNDYIKVNVEP